MKEQIESNVLLKNRTSAEHVKGANLMQTYGTRSKSFLSWILIVLAVVAVGVAIWFFISQGNVSASQASDHNKVKQTPVNVATATLNSVPIEVRSIGNVLAYSVVNVTPQVSGQLLNVHFTQGQMVKKGDLLFDIDPRVYQAALVQAEGTIEKDNAQIQAAEANKAKDEAQVGQAQAALAKDLAQGRFASTEKYRYSSLAGQGAVSREQSDQMNTNSQAADATIASDRKAIENAQAVVRADQAAINTAKGTLAADQGTAANARVQLSFCKIYSPLDGRTSSLNVYQGNVVAPGVQAPLVSIAQVTPIYVTVAIPEQYLAEVRRSQSLGTLKMQALIEGVKSDPVNGTISFIENTVNTTTGTIMLRAMFPNSDGRLYPGQFVDVILTMPPAGQTVVVPARAVQATQQGQSVWVVRDGKSVLTPVEVGQTFGEMASINSGLKPGDVVVTDGQMQLTPDSPVRIQAQGSDGSPSGGRHHHQGGDGAPGPAAANQQAGGDGAPGPAVNQQAEGDGAPGPALNQQAGGDGAPGPTMNQPSGGAGAGAGQQWTSPTVPGGMSSPGGSKLPTPTAGSGGRHHFRG